jgi:hypothetical protein
VNPKSQTVAIAKEQTTPATSKKKRERKRKEPHTIAIKEFRLLRDKLGRIRRVSRH